ncbi:MAG TPA: cation-translocating P-type ATPase [Mycobacterium sp.]|nr:cation-translocating P-type ATPase [Mycobacterium sp.]
MQATSAVVAAVGSVAGSAAGAGVNLATLPARQTAKMLSKQAKTLSRELAGPLSRRCSVTGDHAWIEVRGLNGPAGAELGTAVLGAARAAPGVRSARLNYPLARLVVDLDWDHPNATSLRGLCRLVSDAEDRCQQADRPAQPVSLPGDGMTQAMRAATLGANAAGLGVATIGRLLRLPGLPLGLESLVVAVDYQPRLRSLLEERIGKPATDTLLSLAAAGVHVLNEAPTSLAVDLLVETVKAGEERAAAEAWRHREPKLAEHAEHPYLPLRPRPEPRPLGPIERHAQRSSWLQAIGAGVVGAATGSPDAAGTAVAVTAPKATRTARESFAATLGRGLAERHGALTLRRESLRELDRVDTVVIDPRVLCSRIMRVAQVRGADDDELVDVWTRAQTLLADADLQPGWHRVGSGPDSPEALVQPMLKRLASAVVSEARRADVEVISIDVDILGELRGIFDELHPLGHRQSLDDALVATVVGYQQDGHDVAVLSAVGVDALMAADVALGVIPAEGPPPWCADLLLPDLSAAWRVLHALPSARAASRRGVEMAAGATALGALLMLPGVRGRGPGPVTTGAAAGALTGYWMARRMTNAPAPRPASTYEWHTMTPEQVRDVLPQPHLAEAPPPVEHAPLVAATLTGLGLTRRGLALTNVPRRMFLQFANAVRSELADPITPVLGLGAAASAILGSPVDAVLVGSVIGGNAVLAATQRLVAERRLNVLLTAQIPLGRKVIPGLDGSNTYLDVIADELRPGDLIEVRPQEVIPADGRLIEAEDLEVDESSLTGESLSVTKQVEATPGAELADRACMIYAGTTVATGTAIAVVTAAGADTYGHRAAELVAGDASTVGLQHQLSLLTRRAWRISLAGGALVSGLALVRRAGLKEAVASGIAVSVAAIPEGLPLVATLAQQASARRLTNSGVLVRVPRSVEALGRVDVVCFDKTGTLSKNRLRVSQVYAAPRHSREEVLRCAADAAPETNGGPQAHATDAAIVEAAVAVNGVEPDDDENEAHLPFRSGRPFSATVSGAEMTVKGAPEVVLASCAKVAPVARRTVDTFAADGLRVIAVARRRLTAAQVRQLGDDPEPDEIARLCTDGLEFVGLLGLSDTPRDEAADLLSELHRRQVPIRLITGDHPITAAAIARELGVPVATEQVISGAEWDALSRKGQERAVGERVVFARMSPENKVQIVQTLERTGKVCAMVGDGANDAAAIRAATIGVGVVTHGSDPARTAADVVLLDGRIHTLVDALDEGRELWQRVQAAVAVLLGGNAGEVAFAIIGSAVTGHSPLNTRQLLLVNLLTDALPATALAVSPPTKRMAGGGHGPDPGLLWRTVAVRGVATASAATAAWAVASFTGRPRRASTIALVSLVSAQLGQTLLDSHDPLVVLTAAGSLAAMGTLISIPGVNTLLGCTWLGPIGWAQALGTAAAATAGAAIVPRIFPALLAPSDDEDEPPEYLVPVEAVEVAPDSGRVPHDAEAEIADAGHTPPRLRIVDNGSNGQGPVRTGPIESGPPVPGGS